MFNSFGNIFRLTSFGESHGPGVGADKFLLKILGNESYAYK